MKHFLSNSIILFSLALVVFPNLFSVVSAQTNGVDVTTVYQISDDQAVDGDIMRNTASGIVRSNLEYDPQVFGVFLQNPLIVFRNVDGTGVPIARSGTANINVSNLNGTIQKGDFITTSALEGKGQKATRSGYIIGSALEGFDGSAGTKVTIQGREVTVGAIPVALRIEYAEIDRARSANRLFDYVDAALFSSVKNPEQFIKVIRYSGAVLVLIATAIFAYLVFARTVSNGIQAIGRNPLAKNSIQIAIILNIIFSSIVIVLGIIASFVLLRA